VLSFLEFSFDLFLPIGIHDNLWWLQGGHGYEFKVRVTDQLASQPEERFLKVVVGFGADVVVLQTNEKRQAIGLENLLVSVLIHTWRFFFRWNTIDLALTFRSLMSTLLPHSTIGIFSHTRTKSRCQLGTFL